MVFDDLTMYGHPSVDKFNEYKQWGSTLSKNEYVSYCLWLFKFNHLEPWVKSMYVSHRFEHDDYKTHCPVSLYGFGTGMMLITEIPWKRVFAIEDKTKIDNHREIAKWLKRERGVNLYKLNTEWRQVDAAIKILSPINKHLIH